MLWQTWLDQNPNWTAHRLQAVDTYGFTPSHVLWPIPKITRDDFVDMIPDIKEVCSRILTGCFYIDRLRVAVFVELPEDAMLLNIAFDFMDPSWNS